MADNYDLISSRPLVRVLSPTSVIPIQVCSIRTKPSGVIADTWVDRAVFDKGAAGPVLTAFAANIETIIGQGKATGGSPSTALDASGLQQAYVDFTVAYTPPSGIAGPITTDVLVPIGLLNGDDTGRSDSPLALAESLIDDAYDSLVAAANG